MSASVPGRSNDVPTVVCRCGRQLKLPGAVPGRVGKCPSCGATFRVGGAEIGETAQPSRQGELAASRARARKPLKTDDGHSDEPLGGYGLTPETEKDETRFDDAPRRDDRSRTKAVVVPKAGPIGRGGIIGMPKSPESSVLGSLKYPFWDGFGIALMLICPIPLAILSLVVLGVLPMALWGPDKSMLALAPITLGFIVVFLVAIGFVLSGLSEIMVTSSRGDVEHPRWPDFDFGVILAALVRWGAAIAFGVAITWWPAQAYMSTRGELGWVDRLVVAEILSLGGALTMTALLSIYLHESIIGVDPRLVLPATLRLGPRLVGPMILLSTFTAIAVFCVWGVYESNRFGFPALLGMTCLAWWYGIYAGIVMARVTGRAYKRRAKIVGWFETKRKRVELPVEVVQTEPVPEI